jgi:3-oxoacyl-ACP reductase-like protein
MTQPLDRKATVFDASSKLREISRDFYERLFEDEFQKEREKKEMEMRIVGLNKDSYQWIEAMYLLQNDQKRRLEQMVSKMGRPEQEESEMTKLWEQTPFNTSDE